MAVLPVFERVETQVIMEVLQKENHSAKELNEIVVIQRGACSTSTLYRRLSELLMASILEKDAGVYSISKFGSNLYRDYQNQTYPVTSRDRRIMQYMSRPISYKELYIHLNISPNKLQGILKKLEGAGLIKEVNNTISGKSSRGRPKRHYQLTQKGMEVVEEGKKLERRARRKR